MQCGATKAPECKRWVEGEEGTAKETLYSSRMEAIRKSSETGDP